VDPARRAAALGACARHEPPEGGLSAGLYELAEASGLALRIDPAATLWFEPGRAICTALGADPWGVLASGALLAAFPQDLVETAQSALAAEGYACARLGQAGPGEGIHTPAGPLPRYEQDEVSRILA
jgi:hydrogenase expression/formation protein HypE